MSSYPASPDWSGAVSALRQADSVLLIAHVTPDADALGSALALGIALRSLGKSAQVSVGELGFQVPSSLDFLPGLDLVVSPENVKPADVVVVCDTSSPERLGVLAASVTDAPMTIAIDHHPTFNGFGTILIIDPEAPATATLALKLVDMLDVQLTRDIASAIYAGLATDTGSFKFQSTTSDTLRTAARLFDAGIQHSDLARKLFDDEPFDALRVLGGALDRAVLLETAVAGQGLVYTTVACGDRGALPELAMERVIDTLRRATEAEIAAVFKQADDGIWKGSLRSKTSINVGEVARALGGGGHNFAAGYTGTNDIDQMIADLIAELDRAAGA
jgi:phosphoesterase RecJ-like protein